MNYFTVLFHTHVHQHVACKLSTFVHVHSVSACSVLCSVILSPGEGVGLPPKFEFILSPVSLLYLVLYILFLIYYIKKIDCTCLSN